MNYLKAFVRGIVYLAMTIPIAICLLWIMLCAFVFGEKPWMEDEHE